MAKGLCQESLQEKARDAVEEGLHRAGHKTSFQLEYAHEIMGFPDLVEDLPPNGITIVLAPGQSWLKDFDEIQFCFLETDKQNVKYLGIRWCSATRSLTVFDCRNFERGIYGFSDYAKRME
jgi:hypothetical protein